VERLYTYRHIEGTPLIVATGFATADVAARWRRQAATVLAAGAACLALVLGAGAALLGEFGRRRAAEAALGAANAELERAAATDALTGLPNRRAFDERLRREWRRAARQGSALSLLLVDVDHFKRFNDAFGHPAGDACLGRVAEALRLVARRPGDQAARVGGEEFALLMPDTDEEGARDLARRLAEAVHAAAIPHPGNAPAGVVTLSVGGATARPDPGPGGDPPSLVAAADRALYSAKDTGRNRAAWAPSPESEPAEGA
jgi:diguanylate cyclase (GGDEF)-like protein